MAKDFIPNLDTRIRAEIEKKKISITELCSRTGLCKKTMYHILSDSSITAVGAVKLADALGVSTDYLLKGTTNPMPYMPQYACSYFKCVNPEQSNNKRCCFYCPDKETCSNPCLNDPGLCGMFV